MLRADLERIAAETSKHTVRLKTAEENILLELWLKHQVEEAEEKTKGRLKAIKDQVNKLKKTQ